MAAPQVVTDFAERMGEPIHDWHGQGDEYIVTLMDGRKFHVPAGLDLSTPPPAAPKPQAEKKPRKPKAPPIDAG